MYSIINYLGHRRQRARHHASPMADRGQGSGSSANGDEQDTPEEEENFPVSPRTPRTTWQRTASLTVGGSIMAPSASRDDSDQSQVTSTSSTSSSIRTEQEDVAEKQEDDLQMPDIDLDDLVVDPNGKWAYYWMGVVATAVMYNCAVIILRVAFRELREHSIYGRLFSTLDNVTDLIYLLDIAVQARTAYLEDGCLITDPEKLVGHYRNKTRFLLDVAAILPLATAYGLFTGFLQLLPFCSFVFDATHLGVPILRITRLLKYHTLAHFFQATDSHTTNPNLLRAFKLSVHLWMVIHWIGCIYYMVSEFEGLGSNEWVYPSGANYTALSRKYILCTYWSTMTLTTIGERPSPVTDLEYVFTGLTFLIGVFVFAAVVGNVGDVISNMYAARQDFQARMDQIKFYMHHRQVPEHLQDRVKKWADYTWNRTKAIDEPSVLQLLPERLRTEIAIHVHLDTLKKVKIFEECEEGLLRELVLKLRPQIYSPGDYICRIGEIGREMYILNHGRVEILVPGSVPGEKTQVAILTPGNYFGEISLLKLDEGQNRRTADVRAIGYSELLCLSRRDLLLALVEYPSAKEILEAQAKERMQQTKHVQRPVHPRAANTTPKRRARDVFADVMKQEGFAKLLSARGHEMSELQKVIGDLKTIVNQTNQGNKKKCECEELQKRLRQKDRALRRSSKRVTELETMMKIRRSASLPVCIRNVLPRQDSSQSDDSYPSRGSDVICHRLYERRDFNGDISHKNSQRPIELHLKRRQILTSASRGTSLGTSFEDDYQNCVSVSSSSSQSQSFDISSSEVQKLECNNGHHSNGNHQNNGDHKRFGVRTNSKDDYSSEVNFLNSLDAVLSDPALLSDSGFLLSDVTSDSDACSSIDDIDDL